MKGDYKKMQKRHKGVLDASDKLAKEDVIPEAKYEAGASTYGKATIRNKRKFGTSGELPDIMTGKKITKDATRGELITKRREEQVQEVVEWKEKHIEMKLVYKCIIKDTKQKKLKLLMKQSMRKGLLTMVRHLSETKEHLVKVVMLDHQRKEVLLK